MIRCTKCNNDKNFLEIHVGGYRKHEWTQENNGRIVFRGSNYDKVEDTHFQCAKCGCNIDDQYRKFLQALFEPYNEKEHGA
jgi:hypothetical protein